MCWTFLISVFVTLDHKKRPFMTLLEYQDDTETFKAKVEELTIRINLFYKIVASKKKKKEVSASR